MKIKMLIIFVVLSVLVCQASAAYIYIISVDVSPNQPSETNLITFDILGSKPEMGWYVEYEQFLQNGTDLQLDLYFAYIPDVLIPGQWTYSKQIQALSAATYNLEVRAFNDYSTTLEDTCTVEFTVVPEPASLILFAIGLPVFRLFSKRKM